MTREDARKLIGGYATGSLTEADRRALFEAALDDQELFDELAREQELKELLDQPGARPRLIAALAPARRSWWKRPLVWSSAGVAAAGILTFAVWTATRGPKPVQIAQVAEPAPPPVIAPKQAPTPRAKKPAIRPSEPKQEEKALVTPPSAALAQQEAPKTAAPMAVPFSASQAARLAGAPPPFAFNYSIEGETLVLKFTSAGYISIHFSPGSDTIVGARVEAGSSRREPLPNNATEASIVFTAEPQTTSGGVSLFRETRSGTVADPSHTRIELLLRIY